MTTQYKNLFSDIEPFENFEDNSSKYDLKKLKPKRVKRQKYSEWEQLALFAEYKSVFELIARGLGGICHQYYFRKYAEPIISKGFKKTRNRKNKEDLLLNFDPDLYTEKEKQKEIRRVNRYNANETRLQVATTRVLKKLTQAQLVDIKRVDKGNLIRLLPKTLRLLEINPKGDVCVNWKSGRNRKKAALLGAYYCKLLASQECNLESLILYIKNGNMIYFDYSKHYILMKRLQEFYKSNKWNYYVTTTEKEKGSPFMDAGLRERDRVNLIEGNKQLDVNSKKLLKSNSNVRQEDESKKKSIYYLTPEREDLTTLNGKNIFIRDFVKLTNQDKFELYADIIDPDFCSSYEIAKKITLLIKAIDPWLNVNYKTYAIFDITIRTLEPIQADDRAKIKDLLLNKNKFNIGDLAKILKLHYSDYQEYKKSIFGDLVLSSIT